MCAVGEESVTALGIDAPLFWAAGGDRQVDQRVRRQILKLGASGGTVNSVNSMRGACLVQGVVAGILARKLIRADLPLTESHPKAALWLLGCSAPGKPPPKIELADLRTYFSGKARDASQHERDAAIAGLSAFAMVNRLPGWDNLLPQEVNPVFPLQQPLGYWMPSRPM